MARLVHISDTEPGYTRRKHGKGFAYYTDRGRRLTGVKSIARIKALVIPPAWKNVWISPDPNGHLQATGFDARGRKQYLYHPAWTEQANLAKFDRMPAFGHALPDLRKKLQEDLKKPGWPREKAVALIVNIMDESYLRIGNRSYEAENGTYGLTTLRRKHLKINKKGFTLAFIAKGGKELTSEFEDEQLRALVKECSQLPGYEIFQYYDEEGKKHPVFSQDVNAYLQEAMGSDFTAKDFRTWGGTVTAVEHYPAAMDDIKEHPQRSLENSIVREVADVLGNTEAVCRAYYIHPVVLNKLTAEDYDNANIKGRAQEVYKKAKRHLDIAEKMALYLIEQSDV